MRTLKDSRRSIMTAMLRFTGNADPERYWDYFERDYIEHQCICMPSHISPDDLKAKEKKFLQNNPDW